MKPFPARATSPDRGAPTPHHSSAPTRFVHCAIFIPLLLLASCDEKRPHATGTAPEGAPIPVTTALATNRESAHTEEIVGTVRPKVRAGLEAKMSGRIEAVHAVAGQRVTNGTVLVELNADEARARLEQARAVLLQAENDLRRAEELRRQNVTTQAEFDATQARYTVAKAAVAEAESVLGHARVLAPFDGVISRKLADVGDLASPGKPLLELEQTGAFRIEADVPESLVENLALGQSLSARVGTTDLAAAVVELSPAADPGSRTFLAKLDLPPSAGVVRSGQFARLRVPTGSSRSIWIPAAALVQRGPLELVFVAKDEKATLRLVRTGARSREEVEILSGLEAGEPVILTPPAPLRDGAAISVAR